MFEQRLLRRLLLSGYEKIPKRAGRPDGAVSLAEFLAYDRVLPVARFRLGFARQEPGDIVLLGVDGRQVQRHTVIRQIRGATRPGRHLGRHNGIALRGIGTKGDVEIAVGHRVLLFICN